MTEVSSKTEELLRSYLNCEERLKEAEREKNRADVAYSNSRNELGRHLCPKNTKDGEEFSIWVNRGGKDKLLIVRYKGGDYQLSWRE